MKAPNLILRGRRDIVFGGEAGVLGPQAHVAHADFGADLFQTRKPQCQYFITQTANAG